MSRQLRPTFSKDQVAQYFDRLKLPEEQRNYDVAELKPEAALVYLTLLQKHHLVQVPFENLTLHYSAHRQVSIHPELLFRKVVSDNNGRGGYCMENNCLFGTLLRSLGFHVYSAGARVFDNDDWTGWSHMVNIVTIAKVKYHVDVGFGGNGPIIPMPLDRTGPILQKHISPAAARLQWRNIPGNTDPDQRLWTYEHQVDDNSDFQLTYCFTELEFLPSDYGIMNYFTSTSPRTFFTRTIVGEKKIVDEDGELAGNLILGNNDLKWRIHGQKEKEITFESEDDRLKALEVHFGIKLAQVDRDGIRGLASEIK